MNMSLDETLELDFDDDKKETCGDMELSEFSGSFLGEALLVSNDPKQSEDNKGVSETYTAEAFPSAASEVKNGSFVDEMEEGETVDSVDYGDVEDGEIGGLPDSEFLKKYSCRFFQKGKCGWGKECRFFHLSDKGLYSMFDAPDVNQDITCHMSHIQEPNFFCYPPPSSEVLCGWDKALMEVKDLIKQSKAKKEEECFEEKKLYMTVENDCVPIGRFWKSFRKEKKEKPKPESAYKRQVRKITSPFLPNKPEKSKSEPEGTNLKSTRTDCIKNSTYHSEWRDPWRRSKTPPKRKRFHSKSLTNSSKSSRCSCDSISESSNKCQSRSPKRVRRRSRSKSFRRSPRARKQSSRKSGRRSSSSSSKISSHSDSSSDFLRRVRKRSRKHRTSSRSPTHIPYKRKKSLSRKTAPSRRRRSRSVSDVVLPFHASRKISGERAITDRKESRSVSRSSSPLQPSRQTRSVEKKHSDHSPEKVQSSSSRSSSSSNLSAAKPETVLNNCNLSCSDMSISPLSYSSTELRPAAIENTTFHSRELIPDTCSIGAFPASLPVSAGTSKRGSTGIAFKSSAVPSKTPTTKALTALEMQLNRYRSDSRPDRGISSSERAQGPLATAKSKVLGSPASKDKRIAKSSGSAKKKSPKEITASNATSKREMLLKQLRCVEEAIARKKKCMKY